MKNLDSRTEEFEEEKNVLNFLKIHDEKLRKIETRKSVFIHFPPEYNY